jgi:hypothetical protein
MNRELARKNIRMALIISAVCAVMFGLAFVAATVYLG